MSERILVTGITGFVGSHLADFVLSLVEEFEQEVELHGTKRWHLSRMDNVAHIEDKIHWHDCNLLDPIGARAVIEEVNPTRVFHCAAESFVSPSWAHPVHYMDANYKMTVNLLDAILQCGYTPKFHIPGSGEEYGDVSEASLPITELTPLNPVNPYAVSKIAQDLIAFVYHRSHGVNVIRTRAFNHEGPRRDKVFGIPWYAYQIARVEAGKQEPLLRVGHLDDRRNFTHVKDMVEAYWLSTEKCVPGELYLIGSDEPDHIMTFREALERLIALRRCHVEITYKTVSEFVRPTQVPRLIGDTRKFRSATGWRPKFSVDQILSETLEYWRERVKLGA